MLEEVRRRATSPGLEGPKDLRCQAKLMNADGHSLQRVVRCTVATVPGAALLCRTVLIPD
jgi:hypothetical protein